MIKEILICDTCGKQSNDICGDEDWIAIQGTCDGCFQFSVADKRDDKGCHRRKQFQTSIKRTDFCSVNCMFKYMGIGKELELK